MSNAGQRPSSKTRSPHNWWLKESGKRGQDHYGKLIAPIQVEGNWYYYWDRSGDGTVADSGGLNGGLDTVTHDVLDSIFKYESTGNTINPQGNTDTTNFYHFATLNGLKLGLPTYGAAVSTSSGSEIAAPPNGFSTSQTPTSVSNDPPGQSNLTYNDLLAIWDQNNGQSTTNVGQGTPLGWVVGDYWSATGGNTGVGSHATVNLNNGGVYNYIDTNVNHVALQVFQVL